MGRVAKVDFEPDLEKTRSLIEKAKGNRSLRKFANSAGLNNNYLCQYLLGHIERPMYPKTLLKIADAAWNGVTAESLLIASGYSPERYIKGWRRLDEKEEKVPTLEEVHQRSFLKKAAYLWLIKKGFATAEVLDNGGSAVLMRKNGEEWILLFLLERDVDTRDRVKEGFAQYSSNEQDRRFCIVVDDWRVCERDFAIPAVGAEGLFLCVDPYTGVVKKFGGSNEKK